MFKSSINKVFLSIGMAVITGSVLLGVSTAFGAPDVSPKDANGVSPTFTGLKIDAGTGKELILSKDSITSNGAGGLKIGLGDSRIVELVSGSVFKMNGELQALAGLTVGTQFAPSYLTIYGPTKVEGKLTFGDTDDIFTIDPGMSGGDSQLRFAGGTVDGLNISSASGEINFNSWPYTNANSKVNIEGDMTVTGTNVKLNATTMIGTSALPQTLIVSGGTYLKGTEIGTGTVPNNLKVYGDLTVNGAINAKLGAFNSRKTQINVNAGSSASVSVTCLSGEVLMSCGTNILITSLDVKYLNTLRTTNSCTTFGVNSSSFATTLEVNAVCFNPNSF